MIVKGASFFQNFEEVQILSDMGGMGTVYKCDKGRRTTVVKCIRPESKDDTFASRFKREIRILKTLDHPNIVRILSFNDSVEPYWYEMEYATQGDLKSCLPKIRTDPSIIKNIFVQICEGLKYLHGNQRPIIHRDLKPQNILMFENHVAKISDVGLARFIDRDSVSLTLTGSSWGTPFYISPEQISDFKHVDLRTDVYALGVILFEIFTDTPNFAGMDIDSELPRPFNALVKKMIRRNPAERYQSIDELLLDYKSKIRFYETVNQSTNPEQSFDEILHSLNASPVPNNSQLAKLEAILEDNKSLPDFICEKIGTIPKSLLEYVARNEPDFFHSFIKNYTDAINAIMEHPFPFGLMNTWTNFLKSAYFMATLHKTKKLCLDRIVFMASSMNQFYSMDRLEEMLSAFSDDLDVDIAIEVLEDESWRHHVARAMKGRTMHIRFREYLMKNE